VANYVAVAEAVRLAEKQTTLLREVMKSRSGAPPAVPRSGGLPPAKQPEGKSPKK
jgi:hypothetical protein